MTPTTTAALIGAGGAVVGALLSNVDDIYRLASRTETVTVQYSGYQPTGIFETELRYFYEVSGVRSTIEDMANRLLETRRIELITQFPERQEAIERALDAVREEVPHVSEIIDIMIPVFEKHYTVEEVQELNRFYSTEIMQNMARKQVLINPEIAPIIDELNQDTMARIEEHIRRIFLGSIRDQ